MAILDWRLPAIDRRHKWLAFAAGYVGFCVLYLLTGHVYWGEPARLPAWAVDRRVPFLSWTVWVYHTQFLFLLFTAWSLRQTATISRTFYRMAAASLISFAVFFVYPTTLPPRQAPATGPLTGWAFALLYSLDPPTNCLPSLHVALAVLAALGVAEEKRRRGWLAFVWAALISVSTLTTKQHYFVDVLAGLVVAGLCAVLPGARRAKANRHGRK